jgi:hypothetical protein
LIADIAFNRSIFTFDHDDGFFHSQVSRQTICQHLHGRAWYDTCGKLAKLDQTIFYVNTYGADITIFRSSIGRSKSCAFLASCSSVSISMRGILSKNARLGF